MPTDPAHFQDALSASSSARCALPAAEIFDDEAGVEPPPGGRSGRWPLKVLSEAVGEARAAFRVGCQT